MFVNNKISFLKFDINEMVSAADIDSWDSAPLTQMMNKVDKNKETGKHLIMWDKQGAAATFFQYKAHLTSFAPAIVKANMAGDKSEALELLRKDLVYTMRCGENHMIDLDKMSIDFSEWKDEAVFNPELVFKRDEWCVKDNYIKFVKDDENHGIGGLNPDHYIMNENWNLVIRVAHETEERVAKVICIIPHIGEFNKLIIT